MSQLSYEQCFKIQEYISIHNCKWTKYSQKDIAKYIWCNQSSVSRELSRCKLLGITYNADIAHKQRKETRSNTNDRIHTKIAQNSDLDVYIRTNLTEQYRSPEQIAWRRNIDHKNKQISCQTIYTHIYEHYPDLVAKYLKRKGKKYNYWRYRTKNKIPNRTSIHQRPQIIEDKERIWDFEWDTIVWSNKWDRIVTCNDRKTWYLFADIILQQAESNLAIATSVAIMMQLKDIERHKLKTITLDNWVEFFDHEYLCEQLWIQTYFADPYSSWQRWANENTNGLLRFFFPKWTDFKTIKIEYFKYIVNLINNRPRKRLWRKTPKEMFFCNK